MSDWYTLPYVLRGHYGVVSIDYAACGRGYVVQLQANRKVREYWGEKSTWQTFQSFATALAYFYALHGREDALWQPGRGRQHPSSLSKNPAPDRLSAAEPHRLKAGHADAGRSATGYYAVHRREDVHEA